MNRLISCHSNQVSSEQALGAAGLNSWLGDGAETAGAADATDAAFDEQRRHLLPAFDETAAEVGMIYDVRGMVGLAERASIAEQYHALAKAGKKWTDELNGWPTFVLSRLKASTELDAIIDLILLKHLITFHLKSTRPFKGPIKEAAEALGMPPELYSCFLEKFSVQSEDGSAHRVTKALSDKTLLHALVLSLHINAFSCRTSELSTDFRMPPPALANFFRLTGCSVSADKADGGHIAVLRAPLVFPVRRRKRAGGGK